MAGVREQRPRSPPPPSAFSLRNVPVVSPWEGAAFSLHVAEEISVRSCSVSVLPRTLMIFGS